MIPTLVIAAARATLAGDRPARLFLLAQIFPLFGGLATVLRALGVLPDSLFTEHSLQLGVTLEVLLFSLALEQRIDALRQDKAETLKQAETDTLTGLYNRAGFELRFSVVLADPAQRLLALLLIDLDHFKPVNDTLDHAAGDIVLHAVASRLNQRLRASSDIVARLGGDEFIVVLTHLRNGRNAETVAEKIIAAMGQSIATPAGTARIGASIGIALAPDNGKNAAKLLHAADAAMYKAKRAGRNRWQRAMSESPSRAD